MKSALKCFFKRTSKLVRHPVKGPLITFLSAAIFTIMGGFILQITGNFALNCLIFLLISLLIMELMFRAVYIFWTGKTYDFIPRIPFERLYIEPHPNIPFIYKKHKTSQRGGEATYPLHKGKFKFGQYTTNNFRFNDGAAGDRDVVIPKPLGLFRVACVGASTTGNYIEQEGVPYSYPMELEKILARKLPSAVEVNNCGQGAYTSADILTRFALSVLDIEPDVVVLCHAYNDIRCYLTPDFDSDYSHCRRNLGDTYWKYKISGSIPNVPSALFDFLISCWLPSNIRYSLIDSVSKGQIDLNCDPLAGLKAYERNMESIIALCLARGIKIVLNTYCHYLYDGIKDNDTYIMYDRIVKLENNIVRKLAEKHALPLVDNEMDFPLEDRYFVDNVHYSPEGMTLLADRIAPKIIETSL